MKISVAQSPDVSCRTARLLLLALLTVIGGVTAAHGSEIPVRVDPRVEMMSIIFHLAGSPEYSQGQVPSYEADINTFFADVKNHPAVALARQLRTDANIGYGDVAALALHVTNPPEMDERVPLGPLPAGLGPRWTSDLARSFLSAARNFARDSHFMVFYSDQQGLYDLTTNRLSIGMENQALKPWCRAFFGTEFSGSFAVIVGLVNGGATYSTQVVTPGGKTAYFSVVGVGQSDSAGMPEFSLDSMQPVMHDYLVAYLAERPAEEMKRFALPGKALYRAVEPIMLGLGYGDWRALVTESLVRAITIRWIAAGPGQGLVPQAIDYQQKMGFYWLPGLNDLLAEYEAQRTQFPNFGAIVPRLAAYLAEYAQNADERIDAVEATWQK